MQLELLWRDEQSLRTELEEQTGVTIEVVVTDNSSSIMNFKFTKGREAGRLRIHRMFLSAEPRVIKALSYWLVRGNRGRSGSIVDDFIRSHDHLIQRKEATEPRLRTRGLCHDLDTAFAELNETYFGGSVTARLSWGHMPGNRRRRSIRLGSYTQEDHLIRIHPLLDQSFVPGYFVRYVLFHEMLHAHLGIEEGPRGRRRIHSREFKGREQAYPDYARAVAWQDNPRNLRRLLRSHR